MLDCSSKILCVPPLWPASEASKSRYGRRRAGKVTVSTADAIKAEVYHSDPALRDRYFGRLRRGSIMGQYNVDCEATA